MDTEKKKRVQTLPKPAQLPLAQPAMPAEYVEPIDLESIYLRQIRTKFDMMMDIPLFTFAFQVKNGGAQRSTLDEKDWQESVQTSLLPRLQEFMQNAQTKGIEAGRTALDSIKFVVKHAVPTIEMLYDREGRKKLLLYLLGSLATTVGPMFPYVAYAWIVLYPVLQELIMILDAYYVYKGALKEIQTNETSEFGVASAVNIATLYHSLNRIKLEFAQAQAELGQVKSQFAQSRSDLQKARTYLEDEQRRSERAREYIEGIMQINSSLSYTIESMQAAHKQQTVEIAGLKQQIDAVKQQRDEAEKARVAAVSAWDASEKVKFEAVYEKQRYQRQVQEEQAIQETLSRQIKNHYDEIASLKQTVAAAKTKDDSYLKRMQEENESLRQSLKQLYLAASRARIVTTPPAAPVTPPAAPAAPAAPVAAQTKGKKEPEKARQKRSKSRARSPTPPKSRRHITVAKPKSSGCSIV